MAKIIAEMCNNHMGDRRIMTSMIKAAADVGVDIVKFQSFRADKLRKDYPNYAEEYAYYKAHELSMADHEWLMQKCKEYEVEFLTTVFDLDTVDFLADLGLRQVKIASPDCNNWALIDKCLGKFDKVLISTGMHTGSEFEKAFFKYSGSGIAWFKCVSKYPAASEELNFIYNPFNGYSDHTIGTDAAKLAIALGKVEFLTMGAYYVEKHFTLNPYLPGKDQQFAGTVEDFREICQWRDKVNVMMGSGARELTEQELENRKKYIGRWNG